MKILFISRAYPPIVGGIENQNFELNKWLSRHAEIKLIANKRGKKFLPFFLPYATIKAIFLMKKYDALLLGDGVLSIVGWKVKLFHRKPIFCVIHGLDLTFKNFLYQHIWVGFFMQKINHFIAVGNETAHVAQEKGIAKEKITFIPNGVDTEKNLGNYTRKDLEKIIGENTDNKRILLTSGRLAKRKGVAWFIQNVVPKLSEDILYVVAGDGPDMSNIQKAIEETNLKNKVKILGYVSDTTRNTLFNTCDIFIQPNIKVAGDMEGFGISVIEAGACRLPVIASKLEGLQDAIKEGKNGFLVEPENSNAYIEKINELLSDDKQRKDFGEQVRQFVIENYSWDKISKIYLETLNKKLH